MNSSKKSVDQSRRWKPSDDSSSVSSMSSFSQRTLCHICKETETLPTKPLIRCRRCKGSWHPGCHKPSIDDSKIVGFQCAKCTRKMNATLNLSHILAPSSGYIAPVDTVPESSKEPDRIATQNTCQRLDCSVPVYQNGSHSNRLCKRHEMEEKHRNATTQKQGSGFKVSSVPKPFKKKKLYPVKPDEDMKTLKRKRPSHSKIDGYNNSELPMISGSASKPPFQRPQLEGSRRSLAAVGGKSRKILPRPAHQGLSTSTSTYGGVTIEGDATTSEGHADMAKPPGALSLELEISNLMLHSAGISAVKQKSTYEELPPFLSDILKKYPTIGNEVIHIPDLRMETLQSNAQGPRSLRNARKATQNDLMREPVSHLQVAEKDTSERSNSLRKGEPVIPNEDNVEMSDHCRVVSLVQSDVSVVTGVEENATIPKGPMSKTQEALLESMRQDSDDSGKDGASVAGEDTHNAVEPRGISSSPALKLYSSLTTPGEDIMQNLSTEETYVTTLPSSLEAQRKERAETFDPTALDSWITKQSLLAKCPQPISQELDKTQLWGHIDPRVAWPEEPSHQWLSDKRKEIEARGGRKSNFGKLLTAQVIQERAERRWGIHQNKDVVDDEKSEDAARALQELFGVKDIDGLEPTLRNGQLVMMEKVVDEEGKKRKKPAVYTVG